ncbi:MAG: hypothetical protein QOC64_2917 [Solirubrobacteraceae bacterium]|nr:hypothetical protein [Solirubrobacteraceae bacterium]
MTPLLSSALLRAQTDERLLALAASGHDRAFEAIVERYRRPLLRYLRRMLSDTLAEDVVQATFLNAWSSLHAGAEVHDLRPWLYRIAHNAAVNALKKVGEAMEEIPESIGGLQTEPAAELERRDEMRRALNGIAALPSRQRTALLAVAVDGRAHADVAAELGLTDGAVRQLVHRARSTLRTAATAITPLPLLHAVVASAGESTVQRVAEVAAGAGAAGGAAGSLKAGAAAVIATGALVTAGPEMARVVSPPNAPAAATEPQTSPPLSPSSGPGGGGAFTTTALPERRSGPGASTAPSEPRRERRPHGGRQEDRSGPSAARGRRKGGEDAADRSGRRDGEPEGGDSANRGPGSAHSDSNGDGSSGTGSSGKDSSGPGSSGTGSSGTGSSGKGSSGTGTSGPGSSGTGSSGGSQSSSGPGDGGAAETAQAQAPGGGAGKGGSGSGGGTSGSGPDGGAGDPDDLVVTPPLTTPEPDSSGAGGSGGGTVETPPSAQTRSVPDATGPALSTPAPAPPADPGVAPATTEGSDSG